MIAHGSQESKFLRPQPPPAILHLATSCSGLDLRGSKQHAQSQELKGLTQLAREYLGPSIFNAPRILLSMMKSRPEWHEKTLPIMYI